MKAHQKSVISKKINKGKKFTEDNITTKKLETKLSSKFNFLSF